MCLHAHTHTLHNSRISPVWQCNYLSVSGVCSQHGPHCRNHFPSATMDRSTEKIKSDWKYLRGLCFFPLFLSVKYLSVVDWKTGKQPKYRLKKKKKTFLWSSTSKDVVIFDIAACTENENHVESSGAEDEEEERRDAANKNAELSSVCPRLTPPDTRRADKDDQPQQRWVSAGVETSGCWLSF